MPQRKRSFSKKPPTLLILVGIVLLVIAIFAFKSDGGTSATTALLEAQLDQALKDKLPTFVFLHSLDCIPCKEMMSVVEQVYPEFQDSIVLIDVDVYDQRNTNILRREELQAIPTLVFYNWQGNRQVHIGVLQPEQLYDILQTLTGEN